MTKRQLVKWLEAKQSDAKAEVEIQYATAEKAYFAQRDEALKINGNCGRGVPFDFGS